MSSANPGQRQTFVTELMLQNNFTRGHLQNLLRSTFLPQQIFSKLGDKSCHKKMFMHDSSCVYTTNLFDKEYVLFERFDPNNHELNTAKLLLNRRCKFVRELNSSESLYQEIVDQCRRQKYY